MIHQLILRPEAEIDLRNAFLWYEDKRTGLGHDFLLQVEAGLKAIERNPEIHPIEYKISRKHLIKRFPYKIIYTINSDIVIVLAVLHGRMKDNVLNKMF